MLCVVISLLYRIFTKKHENEAHFHFACILSAIGFYNPLFCACCVNAASSSSAPIRCALCMCLFALILQHNVFFLYGILVLFCPGSILLYVPEHARVSNPLETLRDTNDYAFMLCRTRNAACAQLVHDEHLPKSRFVHAFV